MNAIVIEHVKVEDLPAAWRAKLVAQPEAQGASRVTVRIEAEGNSVPIAAPFADDLLFGMWSDREDMADVAGYIREIRAPRFSDDKAPNKG